ncbi:MAG TPA: GFA family protein [Sphingomicrobium sp.]|nr:GFA family protein [Sphingomicrobium sp.]
MAEKMTGGCACGRVRYSAVVKSDDAYLCHCRMCQRASGSVSLALMNAKQAEVEWSQQPDWYDSSAIAIRPFCAKCGTSFGFQFKDGSENMDLTVASFDDPSRFVPKHHFGAENIHRKWLDTEGLPEIRTADYDKLVQKWIDATGKFPG